MIQFLIFYFQVLVELAQLQDEEVGDGTTSVVIIAAELLKNADELVKQKIHPTSIMAGYRLACKESVKYIQVRYNMGLGVFQDAFWGDINSGSDKLVKTENSSKFHHGWVSISL